MAVKCARLPDGSVDYFVALLQDITERKRFLEAALRQTHAGDLLGVSRQAGMAEVATSVLHNVGNVLNSVNVSSSLIADKCARPRPATWPKPSPCCASTRTTWAHFLTHDPKGRQLPAYLNSLAEHLAGEQAEIAQGTQIATANIDHIKEIIAMQQSYARVLGVVESLPVVDLVEDALRLNAGAMDRHRVKVIREFSEVPPILVDKHKVLQILVNLIRNAKYAWTIAGTRDKRIVVRVGLERRLPR